jgi:hypothetical protein
MWLPFPLEPTRHGIATFSIAIHSIAKNGITTLSIKIVYTILSIQEKIQ